jgi:hypothetical protein
VGSKLCFDSSNIAWKSAANAACATLGIATNLFEESRNFFAMGAEWAQNQTDQNSLNVSENAHARFWEHWTRDKTDNNFDLPCYMKSFIMHVLGKPEPIYSPEHGIISPASTVAVALVEKPISPVSSVVVTRDRGPRDRQRPRQYHGVGG